MSKSLPNPTDDEEALRSINAALVIMGMKNSSEVDAIKNIDFDFISVP
jgi:hypothetical protein